MKTPVNRLGIYHDVKQILDAALAAGGGSYELPTPGQAVHWRQRAYKFRKLFAEIHFPNGRGESPYDKLTLPKPDGTVVRINVRTQPGVFVPDSVEPVGDYISTDPLFDEALDIAKRLGLED